LWRAVEALVRDLRGHGVPVAIGELVDAARALPHVDPLRREEVRAALACTLVKDAHHGPIFDALFERHFAPRPWGADGPGGAGAASADDGSSDGADLTDRLRAALALGGGTELRALAAEAVTAFAGLGEGSRTERYHVTRVLRALDLAALVTAAVRRAREDGASLTREDLEERTAALRRWVRAEVRARLADRPDGLARSGGPGGPDGSRGPGDAAGRGADPTAVAFDRATPEELEAMRRAVRPLARQLAARLQRRRAPRGGRVELRHTIRRSLSSGGVPFDVVRRRPRAHAPEVFLLCDVSGSVAEFAAFTLTFLAALSGELATTRSFAFVDAVDEITDLVRHSPFGVEPWQLFQHGAVVGPDGHSDYGAVLDAFWERYGRTGVTARSTVLVTGDARTNHRPARPDLLGAIARRARAVYWLNPEPRDRWDTNDSAMGAFAPHCRAVFEVRTLRQLSDAVHEIL
jgi:uncharacterized protein with von Willebrand factor type A (vWA) domain